MESEDGTIYYYLGGKIMRVSADGSGEKTAIEGVLFEQARGFTLTREGIYYRPAQAPTEVRLFNPVSGTSRLILKSDKGGEPGLSVSPDGHWLLFGVVERNAGSDLMLVENFH